MFHITCIGSVGTKNPINVWQRKYCFQSQMWVSKIQRAKERAGVGIREGWPTTPSFKGFVTHLWLGNAAIEQDFSKTNASNAVASGPKTEEKKTKVVIISSQLTWEEHGGVQWHSYKQHKGKERQRQGKVCGSFNYIRMSSLCETTTTICLVSRDAADLHIYADEISVHPTM